MGEIVVNLDNLLYFFHLSADLIFELNIKPCLPIGSEHIKVGDVTPKQRK